MLETSAIDFLQDLDFNDNVYFYHVTEKGIGEKILENGLLMADSHYWSTIIELTPEMIVDPYKFLADEHGHNIRKTEEMILIGCDKEDVNYLVTKNTFNTNNWNFEENPNYVILKDFIIGYIDLTDMEYPLILNPDYSHNIGRF